MVTSLADQLIRVVHDTAKALRAIPENVAAGRQAPDRWSIKEIVGHLVDSAANNHHRFVRVQGAADLAFPGYDQDLWVRAQQYQDRPWADLIDLWVTYNLHLAHVIGRIPPERLPTPCRIGAADPVTLGFLVEDYLTHLRHHLRQIDDRRDV